MRAREIGQAHSAKKALNKEIGAISVLAKEVEGKGLPKDGPLQRDRFRTQSREDLPQTLQRISA